MLAVGKIHVDIGFFGGGGVLTRSLEEEVDDNPSHCLFHPEKKTIQANQSLPIANLVSNSPIAMMRL